MSFYGWGKIDAGLYDLASNFNDFSICIYFPSL